MSPDLEAIKKKTGPQGPGSRSTPHPEGCVKASKGGYGLQKLSVTAGIYLGPGRRGGNGAVRMYAMRGPHAYAGRAGSSLPLARCSDQEIPEDLDFFRGLQFLGIDENDRHGWELDLA